MVFSKQVVAIVGATCTGKTNLAVELATKLHGEIIAADSRTIYKKMDIGTAKPTPQQQKGIKHHALDLVEPSRFFTVSEYTKVAKSAIEDIINRGKMPIVCGGTGLYTRALLDGIQIPPVAPQHDLRNELNHYADKNSNEALFSWLKTIDAEAAKRLNANDRRRIIRALEVYLVTGQTFSQLACKKDSPYQTLWIGLNWNDRSLHKKLIIERLNAQLENGLLEEIRGLLTEPSYLSVLNNAINYKEFLSYLSGTTNFENAVQQCIQNNYQLARKQMIWFRANSKINWIQLDSLPTEDQLQRILQLCP